MAAVGTQNTSFEQERAGHKRGLSVAVGARKGRMRISFHSSGEWARAADSTCGLEALRVYCTGGAVRRSHRRRRACSVTSAEKSCHQSESRVTARHALTPRISAVGVVKLVRDVTRAPTRHTCTRATGRATRPDARRGAESGKNRTSDANIASVR